MQPEAREMIGIQSERECQQNWVWAESERIAIVDRQNLSFCPKYQHLKTKLSRWALSKSRRNC